jgi:hypothetical protein
MPWFWLVCTNIASCLLASIVGTNGLTSKINLNYFFNITNTPPFKILKSILNYFLNITNIPSKFQNPFKSYFLNITKISSSLLVEAESSESL